MVHAQRTKSELGMHAECLENMKEAWELLKEIIKRALQTSQVHPQLNKYTAKSMNQFLQQQLGC